MKRGWRGDVKGEKGEVAQKRGEKGERGTRRGGGGKGREKGRNISLKIDG